LDCLQIFIANVELKPLHANNPGELVRHIRWASTEAVKTGTDAKKFAQ